MIVVHEKQSCFEHEETVHHSSVLFCTSYIVYIGDWEILLEIRLLFQNQKSQKLSLQNARLA
jgi:hypothetical protein